MTLWRQLASWTGNSWKDRLNGSVQMEGKGKLGFLIKRENRSQWRHPSREAWPALMGKGMRQHSSEHPGARGWKQEGTEDELSKFCLPGSAITPGQCPGEVTCCGHPLQPDVWVGIPALPLRYQMNLGQSHQWSDWIISLSDKRELVIKRIIWINMYMSIEETSTVYLSLMCSLLLLDGDWIYSHELLICP